MEGRDALGEGSYGTVRAATHIQSSISVAIKNYKDKSPQVCEQLCLEELYFYIHLGHHPNIARLVDVVTNRKGIGIVLLSAGETLSCKTSIMHADVVNETCRQLICGLDLCMRKCYPR